MDHINVILAERQTDANGRVILCGQISGGVLGGYSVGYRYTGTWTTDTPVSAPITDGCVRCMDMDMAREAMEILDTHDGDSRYVYRWWRHRIGE